MKKSIIQGTDQPRTTKTLMADLRALGVEQGMTLLVHSSLKSLGWVCGESEAVIQALMDAVTEEGTLILPAHSAVLSDPADWQNPPVPKDWWEPIKESMPPFNPTTTPTWGVGLIPERFRSYPGVYRSNHPNMSMAAWGKHAAYITENHSLDNGLGERSPIAKAYELDADVLFLGTDFDSHTSFHLSEHRAGVRNTVAKGAPILMDGKRVWRNYLEIDYDDECFGEIGKAFEGKHDVRIGKIGSATSKLFKLRPSVDFGVQWLKEHKSK
ncbi:AAC(3) family N-acetyltransferase [Pseudalkalibacillus sp. SCS-8]|uniref:aminoglycoside N(3)-acetyltransferase n=1 Tax=Pseudalkalibacillus nanhaiensis TaxID=3115291 RepID=UPI0032DB0AAA